MNPPRPTPARLRSIETRLRRCVNDCDAMLQGNVKSTDAFRLDIIRESRANLKAALDHLSKLT